MLHASRAAAACGRAAVRSRSTLAIMVTPVAPVRKPEHRFAVGVSIVVALVAFLFIPQRVQPLPFWIIPIVGFLMLIPLVLLNPRRLEKERMWARVMSVSLGLILTIVNQVTIVLTIHELITGKASAPDVLLTAGEVWGTNIIAFALVYWELDLGGPYQRRLYNSRDVRQADLRFPQHDGAPGNKYWEPSFFDYLYSSLSNQMAFSATDAMPMTRRMKALMGYQALAGFILLALVISRAVNILQ
jgi:uncharacterized membrane protein